LDSITSSSNGTRYTLVGYGHEGCWKCDRDLDSQVWRQPTFRPVEESEAWIDRVYVLDDHTVEEFSGDSERRASGMLDWRTGLIAIRSLSSTPMD